MQAFENSDGGWEREGRKESAYQTVIGLRCSGDRHIDLTVSATGAHCRLVINSALTSVVLLDTPTASRASPLAFLLSPASHPFFNFLI